MDRAEALERIKCRLADLPDDRVEALADLADAWASPTVFLTLSDADKAEIDAALDELDRGEGVPWASVKLDLEERIAKSGLR